jgi:hypothetical protein
MQTQLLRNAFVHRLQVPVRCQPLIALPSTRPRPAGRKRLPPCSAASQWWRWLREVKCRTGEGGGAGFSRPTRRHCPARRPQSVPSSQRAMGYGQPWKGGCPYSMDSRLFWGEESRCRDGLCTRTQRYRTFLSQRMASPRSFRQRGVYLKRGGPLRSQGLALRCAVLLRSTPIPALPAGCAVATVP